MTAAHITTEIPRDRFGRPMVLLPDGQKREAYRRTTTFVGVLEDTYNLMQWKQRQTALGLAARQDLMLGVTAASADDKKTLNGLCEQAVEAAQSGAKATIGTALHSFTERLDKGLDISNIPAPYDRDLEAYQAATKDLQNLHIEQFRVYDPWKVAGTTDRIVSYQGAHFIADVKTGDIEWGALKIAMQLALYAHSTPYIDDQRTPDSVSVNTQRGIIIHLPAGTGTCTLHWVDLQKGWAACQTAYKVWEHRAWKRELMWSLSEEPKNHLDRNLISPTMLDKVSTAGTKEELRAMWAKAVESGVCDDRFRAAVKQRLAALEGN